MRQSLTGSKLRSQTLASYEKAVGEMLALPPSHPHNWYRLGITHLMDCPHGNWWFLPWHRGYIFEFEKLCRKYSGDSDFSLPFWDWTSSPFVPATMFNGVLSSTASEFINTPSEFEEKYRTSIGEWFGSLDEPRKESIRTRFDITSAADVLAFAASQLPRFRAEARGLSAAAPDLDDPTKEAINIESLRLALKPDSTVEYDFPKFASSAAANHHERSRSEALESGPHDNIHVGVNGVMASFMSPVDPIFWLHHCNIDRIWHIWTRRQKSLGNPELPSAAAWNAEPFLFFSDDQSNTLSKSSGDYSDIQTLGYDYEAGSGEELASPTQVVASSQSVSFEATGFASQTLRTFREVGVNLRIPNETLVTARVPVEQRSPEELQIAANLEAEISIVPPSDSDKVRLMVFANCPYLSRNTPATDPHYVGTISFFGANHGSHHGQGVPFTYVLPLSNTVKSLAESGQPIRSQVRLQFMAIDDAGKVRELDSSLASVKILAI